MGSWLQHTQNLFINYVILDGLKDKYQFHKNKEVIQLHLNVISKIILRFINNCTCYNDRLIKIVFHCLFSSHIYKKKFQQSKYDEWTELNKNISI